MITCVCVCVYVVCQCNDHPKCGRIHVPHTSEKKSRCVAQKQDQNNHIIDEASELQCTMHTIANIFTGILWLTHSKFILYTSLNATHSHTHTCSRRKSFPTSAQRQTANDVIKIENLKCVRNIYVFDIKRKKIYTKRLHLYVFIHIYIHTDNNTNSPIFNIIQISFM